MLWSGKIWGLFKLIANLQTKEHHASIYFRIFCWVLSIKKKKISKVSAWIQGQKLCGVWPLVSIVSSYFLLLSFSSFFLCLSPLMPLSVVTPCPSIRHCCSYSLETYVCLLIPRTLPPLIPNSPFSVSPRILLSLPVLPVAYRGTNNQETVMWYGQGTCEYRRWLACFHTATFLKEYWHNVE